MASAASMAELTGQRLAEAVEGALEVEVTAEGVRPWRLPSEARRYAAPALALMAEFSAGVRLRLLTAAPAIELEVTVTRLLQRGTDGTAAPAPFVAVVDGLEVDRAEVLDGPLVREQEDRSLLRQPGGARRLLVLRLTDAADLVPDTPPASPVPAGIRLVEVWLPADAGVLLHRVRASAPVRAAPPDRRPRWLHYGSSISHGGQAGSPLATWPRLAAAALDLDGVNLGFGGNALLDPAVARAIAAAPADLISLEVGINVVTA
ncbi:MAG: SGNH/GDSL hydrolase family protein, partial [Herbiconiux sp.]|nr:SGNH/GDSL hydrolase family protein [Herbiconiux sp.]